MPKKESVRKMFDDIAPGYDRLNHILSLDVDRSWRRKAVRATVGPEVMSVLDVACGTGDTAIAVAKALPEGGTVTGVDISEGMMALVKDKAIKAGVESRVRTETADGEDLPYEDRSFDRVTCSFGIRNFEHKELGLREFRRVLKDGGKAVILELSLPRNAVVRFFYDLYFLHVLPFVGGLVSGRRSAYRYLPSSVHTFPKEKEFMEMMQEAGFRNVRSRSFSFGLCRMFTGER
jgi:demethylmenaquinone methyltransferase/2-methoxy-6-polyprenyl-1,4-benzoquinol methylase